jgi:hypothetical protein
LSEEANQRNLILYLELVFYDFIAAVECETHAIRDKISNDYAIIQLVLNDVIGVVFDDKLDKVLLLL